MRGACAIHPYASGDGKLYYRSDHGVFRKDPEAVRENSCCCDDGPEASNDRLWDSEIPNAVRPVPSHRKLEGF